MRCSIIALSAALFTASAAFAAAPTAPPAPAPETISQAFDSAASQNPSLQSARYEVEATRQNLPLAWSEILPQINVTVSANHNTRSEPAFSRFVQQQPDYWIGSVTTSWMIFGSGRVAGSTAQARAQIAESAARYGEAVNDLLLEVAGAYSGVQFARTVRAAQERSLANLIEQLQYVEANNKRGFLTLTDVAQARARVEQARAGLSQANAQLIEAEERYLRSVGHRPGALAETTPPDAMPEDLQSAIDRAREYNPTVLRDAARLKVSEQALRVTAASGRPRVSIEANDAIFKQYNPSVGKEESEDLLALRVSVPLFSGGAIHARTVQARATRNAASFALQDTENAATQRVSNAWANLQAARLGLKAQKLRVEAAELARRGMQREQRAGLRSTIDVLNQEQEFLSATVDLARAQRDSEVADYELAAAMGALQVASPPKHK